MLPIDILFWSCLTLGGAFILLTVLMGGFSHVAGHIGGIGHTLHIPVIDHLLGHGDAAAGGHVHGGHTAHGHGAHGHADAATGHQTHGPGDADSHGLHPEFHHHAHGGEESGGFSILQYLNPMSVAGFMVGFGGIGVATRLAGAPPTISALYGATGGFGMWLIAYLLVSRMFAAAGGTSHTLRFDVIGVRAKVTAPIAGGKPGMVSYTLSGSRQSLPAVSDDEEAIPTGSTVRIRKVENNVVHVMRIE